MADTKIDPRIRALYYVCLLGINPANDLEVSKYLENIYHRITTEKGSFFFNGHAKYYSIDEVINRIVKEIKEDKILLGWLII